MGWLGFRREPSSCLTRERARRASAQLNLLIDPQAWMRRRVEAIELLDDTSVNRRVSIDFMVPETLADSKVTDVLVPHLPLTLLSKATLKNFDLRDGEGRPIPMLTKVENGLIAGDTLIVAAEAAIGCALPGAMEGRLRRLAEGDPDSAQREFRSWQALARATTGPDARHWATLVGDDGFCSYADTLVGQFVLLACLPSMPGQRRLVKLSYDEPFRLHGGGLKRWMGWSRETVEIDVPSANLASSFHLEMAAPRDMEIDSARLAFRDEAGSAPAAADDETFDGPCVQRAHLYASAVPPEYSAKAIVYLRCRRPGLLRGTVLAGGLMVGVLALGYAFLNRFVDAANSQTAAALLVLGPTLFAASLIRPGEHRLASVTLVGVRAAVATQMAASVFAVSLLIGVGASIRNWLWLGALAVSVLAQALIVASYLLPRATKV